MATLSSAESDAAEPAQFELPSRLALALESRVFAELSAFYRVAPLLGMGRRGDGHPALVLPGFATSDQATAPLRAALRRAGFQAHGWELGSNRGSSSQTVERTTAHLCSLCERSGQPVSIIGHSAGGMLGRAIARRTPELVRQVITVGSPFRFRRGDRSTVSAIAELVRDPNARPLSKRPREEHRPPLPVPTTAIYSRSDGIVDWRSCIEAVGDHRENVEVRSSHAGLMHHPAVLVVILDRCPSVPASGRRSCPPCDPPRVIPPSRVVATVARSSAPSALTTTAVGSVRGDTCPDVRAPARTLAP
jgi:pimeloyl-ACP methyl ester carboxylesterase